jgi:periplasmic protein TonB
MSQRNERSKQPALNGVTHWLIHQAAHRAPETLSSRLEEEWLADFESRTTALSRLRFAVGCCWASLVIVSEYPRSRVPATSPVAAASAVGPASGFLTLADRNFRYFSLRSATLFLIAGLHAALFFGLITTLSHTRRTVATPDLQNHTVESAPRAKDPPPVLGSEFKDWTIYVPKPVIDVPKVDIDVDLTGELSDKPREVIAEPGIPPVTPSHLVQRLAGGPGAGFPETAEFYPSHSIRLAEEGISTVEVCVDKRGRLTSDPTTVKGSGSERLDEAALKLARAGSGHYRATTEDGQAVNSCYAFGVRFQLRK